MSPSPPDLRPTLMWFRRDLRLSDNPALAAAARRGPLVPVFVRPNGAAERLPGGAGLWWLDKSLRALSEGLGGLGAPLVLRSGDPVQVLTALANECGAAAIAFNRLYEGREVETERRLARAAREAGLELLSFQADLIIEPGGLKTREGGVYHVFTPFWRAFRAAADPGPAHAPPRALTGLSPAPSGEGLDHWAFHPRSPDWSGGFSDWTPGETGARRKLADFIKTGLSGYEVQRNRPDLDLTSRLSPHLHWGEISAGEIWRRVSAAMTRGERGDRDGASYLSELAWREFNHHLLFERPELGSQNFRPAFDAFPWRRAPGALAAWRRGRTGFPMVDAGMRQLWTSGFMHNRVRMIAASFLIKHLLIDWREGEAHFWDTLVDASPANNILNWQWVAGSGADAAPFFRIFNPIAQGERFDPEGAYIRRWVPELARLPAALIHAPFNAPREALEAAGVELGISYPKPIVAHAEARRRALDAYASLPKGA